MDIPSDNDESSGNSSSDSEEKRGKKEISEYEFFDACQWKEFEKFKAMLALKPGWLNKRDRYLETPLLISSQKDNKFTELFFYLMSFPEIEVNCPKNNGFTPLIITAMNGLVEKVKALLARAEIDVNAQESNWGGTALHHACEKGQVEVVQLLLSHPSIDLEVLNRDGQMACELLDVKKEEKSYEKEEIRRVIQHWYCEHLPELEINRKDEKGRTLLMKAMRCRLYRVVEMLLQQSTLEVNAQDENGDTALFFLESGNCPLLQSFISDPRVDVNLPNKKGNSFLFERCLSEKEEFLRILCSHPQINLNQANANHQTILHRSCSQNCYKGYHSDNRDDLDDIQRLQFFLSFPSINVNLQDTDGDTPLHKACYYLNKQKILLLLDMPGIDVNLCNRRNCTPAGNIREPSYDADEREKKAKAALKSLFQDWEDLHRNDTAIFFTEMAANYFENASIPQPPQPTSTESSSEGSVNQWLLYQLIVACKEGNLSTVQTLLASHSELANKTLIYKVMTSSWWVQVMTYSTTPLLIACSYHHPEIVQCLLSCNNITTPVNINFQDEIMGNTALMVACLHGWEEIVKLLLQVPTIDVNLTRKKEFEGNAALHLAAKFGRLDIVLLLLSHPKIDVTLLNQNNEMAIDLMFASHYAAKEEEESKKVRYYNGCVVQGVSCHSLMREALQDWVKQRPEVQFRLAWRKHQFSEILMLLREHPHFVNLVLDEQTGDNTVLQTLRAKYWSYSYSSSMSPPDDSFILEIFKIPELQINFQDKLGTTILHMVCRCLRGKSESDKTLLNMVLQHPQLDVNLQDKNGRTALHTVVCSGNTAILKALLSSSHRHIFNTSLKDKDGQTALDCCAELDEMEEFDGDGYIALFEKMLKEYIKKHPANRFPPRTTKANTTPVSKGGGSISSHSTSAAKSSTVAGTMRRPTTSPAASTSTTTMAKKTTTGHLNKATPGEIDEGMLADIETMSTVSSLTEGSTFSTLLPTRKNATRMNMNSKAATAGSISSRSTTTSQSSVGRGIPLKGPPMNPSASSSRKATTTTGTSSVGKKPPASLTATAVTTSQTNPKSRSTATTATTTTTTTRTEYDLFLTHDWGEGHHNHHKVSKINAYLQRQGFKTWFDAERLTGDILYQITSGIERSKLLLVFLTKAYHEKVNGINERDYCLLEFRHALHILGAQAMIPVVMEAAMKNTNDWKGRVGASLASKIYCDFSEIPEGEEEEEEWEEGMEPACLERLVTMIRSRLGSTP